MYFMYYAFLCPACCMLPHVVVPTNSHLVPTPARYKEIERRKTYRRWLGDGFRHLDSMSGSSQATIPGAITKARAHQC